MSELQFHPNKHQNLLLLLLFYITYSIAIKVIEKHLLFSWADVYTIIVTGKLRTILYSIVHHLSSERLALPIA